MPARIYESPKICERCGREFKRTVSPSGRREAMGDFSRRRFCSHSCFWEWNSGENNYNYSGGIRRGHNWGYLRVTDGRYVHRVVAETTLGREAQEIPRQTSAAGCAREVLLWIER